jgi:hypothetical protein
MIDKDNQIKNESKAAPLPDQPVDKLDLVLHDATHEQLCDIIRRKSERDDCFRSEVLMRLGVPDLKEVLGTAKERVRIAVRQNTRRGFIGCGGCDAICNEISDSLDAARSMYLDKFPEIAFEIALYLLISEAKLASTADSSSGSLTFVTNMTTELLEAACDNIAASENVKLKKSCYEKLCKESRNKAFDGWSEWSYDILEIAAMLTTQKNFQKLDEILTEFSQRDEQRSCPSSYFRVAQAKVRLRMTETLEGKAAARTFIDAHLDMDEMRLLAVRQDMETGAYQNAEHLCLDIISSPNDNYYDRTEKWMRLLFDIYSATGETQKQIDIADKLVFRGKTQYYGKMKALYGENWESEYPAIRARYKTSPSYMYILNAEHDWLLLLNEVKEHPSTVFQYGKALAEYSPEAVYNIYRSEIVRGAAEASNRHEYKRVCTSIRELSAAGGMEEALMLIDELGEKYKRRPAMIDELNTLLRKLTKAARK